MKKIVLTITPVILVLLLAILFRFYRLSEFPVSLTLDEVEIGYNAWSLLKTGRDAWNKPLPLVFYSVGDYKPPVNVYLTVLPAAIFGLSEPAVRFPSAILGSLSVIPLMIILRRLRFSRWSAVAAGVWLAILPWHLHYSRAGFEAVTALFMVLTGLACFLTAVTRRSVGWLWAAVVMFSLAVWAYHATRLFVPLLVLFLCVTYRNSLSFLFVSFRKLFWLFLTFILLASPFLYLTVWTPAIRTRAASTSILRDYTLIRTLHKGNYQTLSQWIFDNDNFLIFHHWAGKYSNYFDIRYWFWKGLFYTPPGFPDIGLFYVVDLVILTIGSAVLIRSGRPGQKSLAVFWLFAGPMAASFAQNDQHALRSLIWIPFFAFPVAAAAQHLMSLHSLKVRLGVSFLYMLVLSFNLIYFYDLYFLHLPRFNSEFWQYGFKDIAQYSCAHQDKYDEIVISETFGSDGPVMSGIPYSYVLFYCGYSPALFQQNHEMPKFRFRRVDARSDIPKKNALLVSSIWDYPQDGVPWSKVVKKVDYLNGKTGFIFVDTSRP